MYAEASTHGYSLCQTPLSAPMGTVFHVKLSRPARRATLVVHVVGAAGWLGLTLGLLALALTAITTQSPAVVEAAVRSMKVFTDWLVIPLALITLLSGLPLSLGTPWGLAKHRWVYTKFWLTLATTAASAFALRPGVNDSAATVAAGNPITDPSGLIAGPIVSLSAYVFMTVISVLKPWGLTRRGRKQRERKQRGQQQRGQKERGQKGGGQKQHGSADEQRASAHKRVDDEDVCQTA
ncbi:DUF2269 domain-containing protein [Streptomyces formicae]